MTCLPVPPARPGVTRHASARTETVAPAASAWQERPVSGSWPVPGAWPRMGIVLTLRMARTITLLTLALLTITVVLLAAITYAVFDPCAWYRVQHERDVRALMPPRKSSIPVTPAERYVREVLEESSERIHRQVLDEHFQTLNAWGCWRGLLLFSRPSKDVK
jgi:hypothetical protein